jgi:RNA polymerase sigma factor (sigma-70 family)
VAAADPRLEELETLYREHFPRFLRLCTAIVGDRELARDAVQDGFANAIRARKRFRGEGSLEGWVWRIVVNAARKARRRRGLVAQAELVGTTSDGRVNLGERELRELLSLLPERQRLAVFLRYYAELDYRRIAETLGIEIGTVSATLHAAQESLRNSLEEAQRDPL